MDIVERLRNQGEFWPNGLANEAADYIERLQNGLKNPTEKMDIVEMLRKRAHEMQLPPTMELRQAADYIERLRFDVEKMSDQWNKLKGDE